MLKETTLRAASSISWGMTYDHIQSSISKSRLAELLERNDMTHDDLAKFLGSSARTLQAIEKGDYDPPLSFAYKLAAALQVPVEQLFSD